LIVNDVTVVGGFLDNLLKNFLAGLKPDMAKLDKAKAKSGVNDLIDSVKGVFGGGAIVSMLLDSAKELAGEWIDGLGVKQPLVIGANRRRSRQDVEDAIRAEGGDPATFSPFLLLLLQYAPMLVELIRKLLGK
jgi:hypothetical protein